MTVADLAPDRVSVVVVSRDRPLALLRCLRGLEQQFHPAFEVVVVADPAAIAALTREGFAPRARLVPFGRANIAEARNLGIAQAAGGIVAFIDDDAVAEPGWLAELTAPFAAPEIAAAGGFVRGRNGISFQWRARTVDGAAETRDLGIPDGPAQTPDPGPGRAVKTEGTNMAVRREVLCRLGGFDPGFAFYLDETDLNLRLAAAGYRTAIAPLAQVHHGFHPSARRRGDRMPRDLTVIGASLALFLRKHAPDRIDERFESARAAERLRLLRHMVAGRAMPGDVGRLLAGFDAGFARGLSLPLNGHALDPAQPPAFRRFATPPTRSCLLSGSWRQLPDLLRQAREIRRQGAVVTVFGFSYSAMFHRVRFTPEGLWLHRGGIFGRSERTQPLFHHATLNGRIAAERRRIAMLRQLEPAPLPPSDP